MKIQTKTGSEGIDTILLEGDLDFHSSPEVRTELAKLVDRQSKKIVIDLHKVSYIDSSGLATFVELYQKMKRYSGKLVLFGLSPGVRSVFIIAKLDAIFKLAKDEKEAAAFVA